METYYCLLLHRKRNKSKKENRQPLNPFLFGNESQEQIKLHTLCIKTKFVDISNR